MATREAVKEYQDIKEKSVYAEHISDSYVNAAVAAYSPTLLFINFSLLGTLSAVLGIPAICKVAEKLKDREAPLEDSKGL